MATDERRTDRELFDMIQSLLNHGEAGYTYVKIDAHLSALRELQSLRAQGGVRVKPLEWAEGPAGHYTKYAESLLGQWAAWEIQGHAYYRAPDMNAGKLAGISERDAIAAAQADYERRILSSLKGVSNG